MDQLNDLESNITQGDVTQTQSPQWIVGPLRGENGYEGRGEHFSVRLNVIKIRNTDGVASNRPSEEQTVHEGKFSQYVPQGVGDGTYQYWMNKIGPYLAEWALGLPRHENPPWRLLKFPMGYTLWIHKSGVTSNRGNPRTDAYLYGAPHLGPSTSRAQSNFTTFRSPTEFVPHAIWLARGSTGQCECKYCIPGQDQTDINRRLNHGIDAESDGESGDDGGNNNAVSRRNRGANAGTSRTRRVRRERSPPINIAIARDYRNRVSDPGPSSAT